MLLKWYLVSLGYWSMHVLVSSLSKKVPMIQALREDLSLLDDDVRIYGGDSDPFCIGQYFVDEFWQMPSLSELNAEDLIAYCKEHQIQGIIPTRDGELPYYARHRDVLKQADIGSMISSPDAVDLCLDKYRFYTELSRLTFPVIPTALSLDEISASRYVVKERYGAGSRQMGIELPKKEVFRHSQNMREPIFQPFIEGREFSIDLYVNLQGKTHGVIVRERELVIDGESQITSSVRMPELEDLCSRMAENMGIYGHAIFQAILDESGAFQVIECNPRWGGASTLSWSMGLRSFYWFLLETRGLPLPAFNRSEKEKRQVRFNSDMMLP